MKLRDVFKSFALFAVCHCTASLWCRQTVRQTSNKPATISDRHWFALERSPVRNRHHGQGFSVALEDVLRKRTMCHEAFACCQCDEKRATYYKYQLTFHHRVRSSILNCLYLEGAKRGASNS